MEDNERDLAQSYVTKTPWPVKKLHKTETTAQNAIKNLDYTKFADRCNIK